MATFDSVNPARPSEVIGTYRVQGAADVDRAVEAAAAAQRRWARVPIPARAGVIVKAGEVLLAGKAELAELVSRECGKILIEAGGDVQEAVDMANFVAGQGRAAWGETVPSELGSKLYRTDQAAGVSYFNVIARRNRLSASGYSPRSACATPQLTSAMVCSGLTRMAR